MSLLKHTSAANRRQAAPWQAAVRPSCKPGGLKLRPKALGNNENLPAGVTRPHAATALSPIALQR